MTNIELIDELSKVYQRLGGRVPKSLHAKIFKRIELLTIGSGIKQSCHEGSKMPSFLVHSHLQNISTILQRLQQAPSDTFAIFLLHEIIHFIVKNNSFTLEDLDMLSCVYQRVYHSDYDYQFLLDKIEDLL
jgi:hypothetical protein